MLSWLRRVTGRREPQGLADLRAAVQSARHPYQAEIDAHRATGGNVFINCRVSGCTLNGVPIPDGEFGPETVDSIPDGVRALAKDEQYIYCDDGERYQRRPPRRLW